MTEKVVPVPFLLATAILPLKKERESLSLCGTSSELIALGGRDRKYLQNCEMYFTSSNKWVDLPSLNIGWKSPGSLLLQSKRAFCFCGEYKFYTIETIQIDCEAKWKTLAFENTKVLLTNSLRGVSLFNSIVLFGGECTGPLTTLILSEEGELLRDLSDDPLIPGAPITFEVLKGSLYSVGFNFFKHKWRYSVRKFNGKKWSLYWLSNKISILWEVMDKWVVLPLLVTSSFLLFVV